ncbi:MAG: LCP family protein [Clostridia bacterium]|nr:LCP family protein [Clostridia bacterium]
MDGEIQKDKAAGNTALSDTINQPKKGHSRKTKVAVIVMSAVLIVLLTASLTVIVLFSHYYSLMDTGDHDGDYSHVESITDSDLEIGQSAELPEDAIYSDSNILNILLIGTDERIEQFDPYARADSIMVLSLNKKTHSVRLVSLERGMTVRLPGEKRYDLLTHTFHYGGAKLVIQTVRTHFSLDTEKYVRVNFYVFRKLIDCIGGVDITLTAKEADALNQYLPCQVSEGKNHLDGYSALMFARLRSIDSDWQRIKRQRKVIASVKNGFKDKSVLELNQIANECLPFVQTNLTSLEFADLMLNLPQYVNGDFKEMTIPKKGTYKGLGNVDFKGNSRILREFLYGKTKETTVTG